MISTDISSVTSSPALPAGRSPLHLPDGPATDLFGREVVPANRSPESGNGEAFQTSVICGQFGFRLSASAVLQWYLGSRLRKRLHGSSERVVIWKNWATPWGECVLRPQVSG